MEYILSIVVIIILILQNSKYNKDSKSLKREINILNDKLNGLYNLLKTEQAPKTVEKERVKDVIKKTIEPPLEVPVKAPSTVQEELEEGLYTNLS